MSETGLCAVDGNGTTREAEQAAAVALAYYIAEAVPNIDMIGFHREMDEAGSPWQLGLYRWDGLAFQASSARPAAEVFRYMDTPQKEQRTNAYAPYAGGQSWADVLSQFGLTFCASP